MSQYYDLVRTNPFALKDIDEQTEQLCIEAVSRDGLALQFVKRQTSAIQMAAVRQNGAAVKYIKHQLDLSDFSSDAHSDTLKKNDYFEHAQNPSIQRLISIQQKNNTDLKSLENGYGGAPTANSPYATMNWDA